VAGRGGGGKKKEKNEGTGGGAGFKPEKHETGDCEKQQKRKGGPALLRTAEASTGKNPRKGEEGAGSNHGKKKRKKKKKKSEIWLTRGEVERFSHQGGDRVKFFCEKEGKAR